MAKQRSRSSKHRSSGRRRAGTPTPTDICKPSTSDLKRQRLKIKKAKDQKDQTAVRRAKRVIAIVTSSQRARREQWAKLAAETQGIVLGDGQYVEERPLPAESPATHPSDGEGPSSPVAPPPTTRVAHNIAPAVLQSRQRTVFYPHYSPKLAQWQDAHQDASSFPSTQIEFVDGSTLNTTRSLIIPLLNDPMAATDIGVLSFASPKRACGNFLHGNGEQEDTIARSSSLIASLTSPPAQEFYKEHRTFRNEDGSGLHDHSMVYSPGVVVFRADAENEPPPGRNGRTSPPADVDPIGGKFIAPYTVNVLSVVPVNAAAVRAKHIIEPGQEQVFEDGIRHAMKERMARALRAFESHGDKVIVLGAFGCGSSENKVDMVASIWAELLVCGETVGNAKKGARFKNSFHRVVFAVPGRLFQPFKAAFQLRLDEEILNVATLSL